MPRPLLEGKEIRKSYGRQVVLDQLSFTVLEGQKIALIGRNGAGKSTLLNILIGSEELDAGEIALLPWTRVGVVKQHEVLPGDVTTEQYLESLSGKQTWEVHKFGAKFGLTQKEFSLPPTALSGGYQMRVKIVGMLLQEPNLLLLDEPVNYLDLSTLLLLERFLAEYEGSFIMTAHDREFLQNTCNTTFEIERAGLSIYPGKVIEYFAYKEEQREFQLRTNKRLKREIAHSQEFVDRFRFKASQASRAQSKLRHIEKLRHQIATVKTDLATARIVIPTPLIIPGSAVRAEKLSVGYGDKVIASDITFEMKRGEKIVIAGENGKGKSTFLKTLAGKLEPLSGSFKWFHRADIGYYDQKTDATLIPQETILQYLTRMAPVTTSGERILMMAGNFLFRNDDLEKTTSVLSGGERARLCLAGILLHEHNVLMLDEPTNHLDVETAESLALALKEYGGTVLFVSHARTFVNALADNIYEVRNGTLKHYTGTYEEYVEDLSERMEESLAAESEALRSKDAPSEEKRREARLLIKEMRKAQDKRQKEIDSLSKEKSAILAYFFENPMDYAPDKSEQLKELERSLMGAEAAWMEGEERLEILLKSI
jgi:ATP-binding cassette subfamily F protein 3